MNQNRNNINSIQALRGIAATMVMFCHFSFLLDSYGYTGTNLFQYGAYGVDIFFIISGFIITYTTKNKKPGSNTSVNFIKNRARRIFPLYYIILILFVVFAGGMSIFHYHNKVENLISAIFFIPILPANAPNYIDVLEIYGVRWTLMYEIYFYLVMAFCLNFKYRWVSFFSWFALSLLVIPFLILGRVNFDTTLQLTDNGYLNLITNPISIEFLIGVIIALSFEKIQKIHFSLKSTITIFSVFLIVYLFLLYKGLTRIDMQVSVIAGLLFLIIILNNDFLSKITPRFLLFLGDISYALYLIHLGMNYMINRRIEDTIIGYGLIKFITYSLLSILLASILHKYIEKPFMKKKKANTLINE
ncbi:acyltransferase [Enterobacter sp. Bisph1]|uniref:acyltransferase family protein n=1 Tax=Enterobacter sp. Bisph1 TaxID=1274399 RepID=UPI00057C091C|nr:acyltransferase [Enterobacter sp. Bisph1]